MRGHFHGHIGHQRADRTRDFFTARQALIDHQVEHFVTVEQPAFGIHHLEPVCVAIQCNTVVGPVLPDGCNQGFRVGGAHFIIDVQAVGRAADGDNLGAQLMKHHGRDLVGRAVRAIDHEFQSSECQVMGKGAFAKLDVAPGRVFQPARLAQRGGIDPRGRLLQGGLHRILPLIVELGALGTEKLDAVVGKRIVAGADHHAKAGALGSREVSHAGRRQGPEQHHVHAGRVKAGLERAFQHVA